MRKSSAGIWGPMISMLRQPEIAFELYQRMQQAGFKGELDHYLALVKACTEAPALAQGRLIHYQVMKSKLELNVFLGTALVYMYVKCGSLEEALQLFDRLSNKNVVTWSALINGYIHHEEAFLALKCFQKMQQEGIKPNEVTFSIVVKACSCMANLNWGRLIHEQIINLEMSSNVIIGNTLIDMYAKCGSLEEAIEVLQKLQSRDVFSWGAIIGGFVQVGKGSYALDLFMKMEEDHITPNKVVYLGVLKACGYIGAVQLGRLIHEKLISSSLILDVVVKNTLIDIYAKCGSPLEAYKLFKNLENRNEVSWNAIITIYAKDEDGVCPLHILERMQVDGIRPNRITFLILLKACGNLGVIEHGKLIHGYVLKDRITSDELQNILIDMYAKCGSLEEACTIFENSSIRDIVSWGALLAGYADHSLVSVTLNLFEKMKQEGIAPNEATFASVLRACGRVGAIEVGRYIHKQILDGVYRSDTTVANTLVDMYAKCGHLEEAWDVFQTLEKTDVVSWNAMIAGYVHQGEGFPALELFESMHHTGIKPNEITFFSALKACGILGAIEKGRIILDCIRKDKLMLDFAMVSTIIDMYAKCGNMEEACKILNALPKKNIISWNAIIAGYAIAGNVALAEQCLQDIVQEGFKPNEVTFASILVTFSRAGLVDEGHWSFGFMTEVNGILPSISHYNCMIDLLGRAGCWHDAQHFLNSSQQPNIIGWKSLLSSCRSYGNTELGRRCFHEIIHLEPQSGAGYVLMANAYAHP